MVVNLEQIAAELFLEERIQDNSRGAGVFHAFDIIDLFGER